MSALALGTYTLKAKGKASSFNPKEQRNQGRPLIVVPREFRSNFTTQRFPNPKDVVIVDVVDLLADTVLVSVIWGGGAIVDSIKDHVPTTGAEPTKLPVMIKPAYSAAGNEYFVLAPLEGAALQLAAAWDAKYPTRIDQERAQHEAAQASAPASPAADPMAAALAALQGGGVQALHNSAQTVQATPLAAPAQSDAIAALQAQLAAALAAQGQAAAPAQPVALAAQGAPVVQSPAPVQEVPPQPAMSDADLEAAINALK